LLCKQCDIAQHQEQKQRQKGFIEMSICLQSTFRPHWFTHSCLSF